MRRVGRLAVLLLVVGCSASALAGGSAAGTAAASLRGTAGGGALEFPLWSGQWQTSTGGVGFRLFNAQDPDVIAAEANHATLLDALKCPAGSIYFAGGYNDPDDSGKVVGCTDVTPGRLLGRYASDTSGSGAGSFDIRIVSLSPLSFDGTYTPDGGAPAPWKGTWLKHFGGDGAAVVFPTCRKTQALGASAIGQCGLTQLWDGAWNVSGGASGTITFAEAPKVFYEPRSSLLPKLPAHAVNGTFAFGCASEGKGEIVAFAERAGTFIASRVYDTLQGDYYCPASGSRGAEYGSFQLTFSDAPNYDKWTGTFTAENRHTSPLKLTGTRVVKATD